MSERQQFMVTRHMLRRARCPEVYLSVCLTLHGFDLSRAYSVREYPPGNEILVFEQLAE